MLTGEITGQIEAIWNAFWSGGISNPREVIEQITYLLFLRRLDDLHTNREQGAAPEEADRPTRLSRGQGQEEAILRGPALIALQAFRAQGEVHRRQRARVPVPAHAWR
jgi:hypothetical protein